VVRRWLLIALPFALILAGAVAFYLSPWPVILHLMLKGAHVRVAHTFQTVGLPLIGGACWVAGLVLAAGMKRKD
jgi:hypothetical protein